MKNQKDFIKKATSNKNLDFRLYFNKKYQNKDIHKWYQKNIKIRSFFDILDVGCGTGAQSNFFSKKINKKGNLYAFDKSNISVINLKKKITGKNKKVFVADMNRFDQINQKYFQKIKFDLINSVYSIYYAKKPLQLISKLIRANLLRVVEELLILYKPFLNKIELELEIAHSEKTNQLSLICQTKGKKFNPLDNKDLEDDIGLKIIHKFTEVVEFKWADNQNRLELLFIN
jgi:SAM-dependent methyltransferase